MPGGVPAAAVRARRCHSTAVRTAGLAARGLAAAAAVDARARRSAAASASRSPSRLRFIAASGTAAAGRSCVGACMNRGGGGLVTTQADLLPAHAESAANVSATAAAGPAFIKWGQWAATRPDMFPADLCRVLSALQTGAPRHGFRCHRRENLMPIFLSTSQYAHAPAVVSGPACCVGCKVKQLETCCGMTGPGRGAGIHAALWRRPSDNPWRRCSLNSGSSRWHRAALHR